MTSRPTIFRALGAAALVSVLAVLAVPAFPVPTQSNETGDESVIRISTRLVLVDVVVADDDGPVSDLAAEEFRLFDDGIERPIDVFTLTESSAGASLGEALPPGVVSNRYDADGRTTSSATVILIDRLNTNPFAQPYADQQVREFLDTLTADDRVAIYELTNTLRLVQDYTSDVKVLERALENAHTAQTIGLADSESALDYGRADPALEAFVTGGNQATAAFEMLVERTFFELRADTSAAALEAIATHLADLPGRKNIVWLSEQFPFSFDPHMHTSFHNIVANPVLDRMEEVGRMLTNSNVAVYPVYAPGLGDGEPAGLDLLMDVAEKTGGRAFFNTNGLATSMRQAADEARAVYTLGFYVAGDAADSGFHELRVEVARDGVDVRHREGYFGFADDVPDDGTVSLVELLIRPTDDAGIGLFGTARESAEAPGVYDVVLQIDVSDLSLSFDGETRSGSLETAMYFQAPGEEARILPPEPMAFRMSEEMFQRTLSSGLNVIRQVETEGVTGWLRVVVREPASGAAGSLRIPIGIE